jgi:hypothetical protein
MLGAAGIGSGGVKKGGDDEVCEGNPSTETQLDAKEEPVAAGREVSKGKSI